MGPGAKIIIKVDKTLELVNSNVHGCTALWDQIGISKGSHFISTGNTFSDANTAIYAAPNSRLTLKNCIFDKNYIGVSVSSKLVSGGGVFADEPLSNNIFECSGNLLSGGTCFAGISVTNSSITVGEAGYPQNQFLNIQFGIVAQTSVVTVENALFQSPPSSINAGNMIGIKSENTSTIEVKNSTFNNCNTDIWSTGSNLKAHKNTSFSTFYGIIIEKSGGRTIDIDDNQITSAKFYGIWARDNGEFGSFTVRNNYIEMELNNHPFVPQAALEMRSAVPVFQSKATIISNRLKLNGSREGVNVVMNGGVNISSNNVEIFHWNSISPSIEHGIRVESSGSCEILDNNVYATGANNSLEIHNIEVVNSDNVTVCGDTVEQGNAGFKLIGANPDMTFGGNLILENNIGLLVAYDNVDGYIGEQAPNFGARDNLWPTNTNYPAWAARNENIDIFVDQSKFHVRSNTTPQMPPSVSASTQWFYDDGSGSSNGCPVNNVTDRPTDFEKLIANGDVPFTAYEDAQLWRAQTNLYRKLKENPQLLGWDNAVDEFYETSENGAIGDFYAITVGINDLETRHSLTAIKYETLESGINENLEELSLIDSQLLTAIGTEYANLVIERHGIISILDSLQSEFADLDSSFFVQKLVKINDLISLNASISTAGLPQEYLQTVNDVYLNTVAKGILELTETQIDVIEPIAYTCQYEVGDPVLGARILLGMEIDSLEFDDELLCSTGNRAQIPSEQKGLFSQTDFSITPNPAKNQVQITFPSSGSTGIIRVYDAWGSLQNIVETGEGQSLQLLSLDGIASGIYTISFKNDKTTISRKLIVLK
jgi:hypothetical protein